MSVPLKARWQKNKNDETTLRVDKVEHRNTGSDALFKHFYGHSAALPAKCWLALREPLKAAHQIKMANSAQLEEWDVSAE